MSYQEKRTVASLGSGALILVLYCWYGVSNYLSQGDVILNDLKFWSTAMLVTLGGGIVVSIVIQILFHIFLAISHEVGKEIRKQGGFPKQTDACEELDISDAEDEMDKLISLKAMRNSYILVGIGFCLALFTLFFKLPPAIMLNIMFISFMLGSLFDGISHIYFYQKEVNNG